MYLDSRLVMYLVALEPIGDKAPLNKKIKLLNSDVITY